MLRIKDFTPVFDEVTQNLDPLASLVFGRIWRYAQNEGGVCYASLTRIGNDLGLSPDTVRRRIEKLMEADYLREKEFVLGETRKFTVNYQVMMSLGLLREGSSQCATPPVAESNTKKVVNKEKENTQSGVIEAFYIHGDKSLELDGYPADVNDALQEFAYKFNRVPGSKREKNTWISGAREWLGMGITAKDIPGMFDYCRERGTVIKSPYSIAFAYDAIRNQEESDPYKGANIVT